MRQVEGRWVYAVECENTFAPCRARASELCPGGYDTLESKKEPRDDRRERGHGQLPPRFFLEITCRDR